MPLSKHALQPLDTPIVNAGCTEARYLIHHRIIFRDTFRELTDRQSLTRAAFPVIVHVVRLVERKSGDIRQNYNSDIRLLYWTELIEESY